MLSIHGRLPRCVFAPSRGLEISRRSLKRILSRKRLGVFHGIAEEEVASVNAERDAPLEVTFVTESAWKRR